MNALSPDDYRLKRWPFGALDLLETVLFYFWKDHKYFKIDGNGFNKLPRKLFFNSPEVSTYYYDLWLSLSFVVMYLIQPHFVNNQLFAYCKLGFLIDFISFERNQNGVPMDDRTGFIPKGIAIKKQRI